MGNKPVFTQEAKAKWQNPVKEPVGRYTACGVFMEDTGKIPKVANNQMYGVDIASNSTVDKLAKKEYAMLPAEFLLRISLGYPVEQAEVVTTVDAITGLVSTEVVYSDIYPNLAMRVDAAKTATPYYTAKKTEVRVIDNTNSGVLLIPCASMENWDADAQLCQAKLKKSMLIDLDISQGYGEIIE